jgi:hypothetical protein
MQFLDFGKLRRKLGTSVIHLLPYFTHKIQPVGISFFGSLEMLLLLLICWWLENNLLRAVAVWQVDELNLHDLCSTGKCRECCYKMASLSI